MKVSELIKKLEKMPQDVSVMLPGFDTEDVCEASQVENALIKRDYYGNAPEYSPHKIVKQDGELVILIR